MKKISFLRHYFVLFIIVLIFYNEQVLGQDKTNILCGFGLPELLNIGINIESNQSQFGIKIGSFPADKAIISICGDFYYHFAGLSTLSKRRLWYVRLGLNYLVDETVKKVDKYLHLNSRIGRDFNISKQIGIELDAGILIQLSHQKIRKEPPGPWGFNFKLPPVVPSIGIAIFYRIFN